MWGVHCVVLVAPNNTTVALLTLNTATIGRCIRTRCISLQTPSAHTHTQCTAREKNVNASLHFFQERQRVENLCQNWSNTNSIKSKLVYCFLVYDGGKLGHIRWIIWISPPCSIPWEKGRSHGTIVVYLGDLNGNGNEIVSAARFWTETVGKMYARAPLYSHYGMDTPPSHYTTEGWIPFSTICVCSQHFHFYRLGSFAS